MLVYTFASVMDASIMSGYVGEANFLFGEVSNISRLICLCNWERINRRFGSLVIPK